ncbi:MAG: potassium channel protein [Myxococcota bacterium]
MSPAPRRVLRAVLGLLAITAFGTVGYMWVEELSLLDALYMTVITVATVGYGEVRPLHPEGRIFTMVLIVSAASTAAYMFAQIAQALVESSLREVLSRRAMDKQIAALANHVIVCGFGRLGHVVAEEVARNGVPLVIVESDPAREPELHESGYPYVLGSAVADEVLLHAGIERARAIVVGTGSDSDNVFITLSARELNPSLRIHARGETDTALRRLEQAGAHQAISAYQMGGTRMANAILRPAVVDFLEIAHSRYGDEVDLEEVRIAPGCVLAGQSVRQLEQRATRLRVVGLKRGEGRIELVPDESTPVLSGDLLVAIGDRESLARIAQLAACP